MCVRTQPPINRTMERMAGPRLVCSLGPQMLLVTTGQTRVVLLVGCYAIKIARPGIGYCLRRVVALWSSGCLHARLDEWRAARGSVRRVVWSAPFYGLLANLNEYRLSRLLPQAGLAPTLLSCGLVNVQRRGRAIATDDVSNHPVVCAMATRNAWSALVNDTARPEQFCQIDGRLELVDYGNPALRDFLESHPDLVRELAGIASATSALLRA